MPPRELRGWVFTGGALTRATGKFQLILSRDTTDHTQSRVATHQMSSVLLPTFSSSSGILGVIGYKKWKEKIPFNGDYRDATRLPTGLVCPGHEGLV